MIIPIDHKFDLMYSKLASREHQQCRDWSGWGGCAAPLVCIDCVGIVFEPVDTQRTVAVSECALDQTYLAVGARDSATFRCFDGTCMQHGCALSMWQWSVESTSGRTITGGFP